MGGTVLCTEAERLCEQAAKISDRNRLTGGRMKHVKNNNEA